MAIDKETGRVARGRITVGPAYHSGGGNIELPVVIYRHLVSAAAHVLYLEQEQGEWRVVRERFIWGA